MPLKKPPQQRVPYKTEKKGPAAKEKGRKPVDGVQGPFKEVKKRDGNRLVKIY